MVKQWCVRIHPTTNIEARARTHRQTHNTQNICQKAKTEKVKKKKNKESIAQDRSVRDCKLVPFPADIRKQK